MKLLIDLSSGGIDPLKLFFATFLKIIEQDQKSLTCQKLKAWREKNLQSIQRQTNKNTKRASQLVLLQETANEVLKSLN